MAVENDEEREAVLDLPSGPPHRLLLVLAFFPTLLASLSSELAGKDNELWEIRKSVYNLGLVW